MQKEILVKNIGMTEKEAAVYTAILELGYSTIKPIATRSGVKRTSVYNFIDHLVEMGLIEQIQIDNRMHYKALHPRNLLELQESRLKEVREAIPDLMSIFNISTEKPHISYFEGAGQIINIMFEELDCKEALYIWPSDKVINTIGGTKAMAEIDRLRKAKKTFIKTIRFKDTETNDWEGSGSKPEDLREIRWAPENLEFPLAIGIYDTGKVGFITSRKESFGILIESKELEIAMRILFNLFWEKSTPN